MQSSVQNEIMLDLSKSCALNNKTWLEAQLTFSLPMQFIKHLKDIAQCTDVYIADLKKGCFCRLLIGKRDRWNWVKYLSHDRLSQRNYNLIKFEKLQSHWIWGILLLEPMIHYYYSKPSVGMLDFRSVNLAIRQADLNLIFTSSTFQTIYVILLNPVSNSQHDWADVILMWDSFCVTFLQLRCFVNSDNHWLLLHFLSYRDIAVKCQTVDLCRHCQSYEDKINELGPIDIQLLGLGRSGHIGFNEKGWQLALLLMLPLALSSGCAACTWL